ncbi:hypothetical protein [Chengkuizengella axinellae]|uniref:Uncharacterized protein n=1 Tax=Chengkuizengella axinellae TaxID=3064388 RepID=A0ABT9J3A2_9BACL|nr:hypothetical protein [Chengkuizengella sp. 2205SS18-9]MDP5276097.1 hypothetical protein [Chengkuizengella sp. 2205SS18-9]
MSSKKDKFAGILNKKTNHSNNTEAHDALLNKQQPDEIIKQGSQLKNVNETVDENKNVNVNVNSDVNNDSNIVEIANNIAKNKAKKSKFEDQYSRATYWIEKDVLKAFNKVAGHGEKTRMINEAIKQYIQRLVD